MVFGEPILPPPESQASEAAYEKLTAEVKAKIVAMWDELQKPNCWGHSRAVACRLSSECFCKSANYQRIVAVPGTSTELFGSDASAHRPGLSPLRRVPAIALLQHNVIPAHVISDRQTKLAGNTNSLRCKPGRYFGRVFLKKRRRCRLLRGSRRVANPIQGIAKISQGFSISLSRQQRVRPRLKLHDDPRYPFGHRKLRLYFDFQPAASSALPTRAVPAAITDVGRAASLRNPNDS